MYVEGQAVPSNMLKLFIHDCKSMKGVVGLFLQSRERVYLERVIEYGAWYLSLIEYIGLGSARQMVKVWYLIRSSFVWVKYCIQHMRRVLWQLNYVCGVWEFERVV